MRIGCIKSITSVGSDINRDKIARSRCLDGVACIQDQVEQGIFQFTLVASDLQIRSDIGHDQRGRLGHSRLGQDAQLGKAVGDINFGTGCSPGSRERQQAACQLLP